MCSYGASKSSDILLRLYKIRACVEIYAWKPKAVPMFRKYLKRPYFSMNDLEILHKWKVRLNFMAEC